MMMLIIPSQIITQHTQLYAQVQEIKTELGPPTKIAEATTIPDVPFYSQFTDITSTTWKKVGCGIASLAMVIEYYKPDTVSVNALLTQAIKAGAYQKNAGWSHAGLINVSKKYGLDGTTHDLSKSSAETALAEFKNYLKNGPVIASIHYKFDPKSTIPHLVVINGIQNNTVYYNDPAAKSGEKQISVEDFEKAWKKRFIVVRPVEKNGTLTATKHKISS